MKPQEIEDEEYEQVLQRVAAVDVAKKAGMVCTRVPHEARPGRRRTRVWEVAATTAAILELGGYLAGEQIEKVTLEATGDYWRIWFYLLESAGLDVQLVSARDVKNVPGRPKTDKLDAVWQAKCTERGMLRPSFVPPPQIRHLRDYTRLRADLTRDRTRYWQRLEKLLEDALIKVSSVASSLDTVSVRDMLDALIAGERDPRVLAGLARARMRAKHDALVEALNGRFDDHHAELARMLLDQIDALSGQIGRLTARIGTLIAAIPAAQGVNADGTTGPAAGLGEDAPVLPAVIRLDEVTGIGQDAAQVIIAEVGLDMTRLPHPRPPGVLGKADPPHDPVRGQEPIRARRQGQPLPQGRPRRGRRRGSQNRHLPRRALPADRQAPRQAEGTGRRGPLHPGHRLAPARRPRHPLPRSRRRLLHQPHRQRPQNPQPHPPARSPRLPSHPGTSRLTATPNPAPLTLHSMVPRPG